MTTQASQENQPILFGDGDNSLARLEGIPSEARKALADLFIILRRATTNEGASW